MQTIEIGKSNNNKIEINLQDFTRHIAYLGGTGSGKTTAALDAIEQILLNKIPVIMIDRKGDLCGYANEPNWLQAAKQERLIKRQNELKKHIHVQLYTPGNPYGNPLSITIVPRGIGLLSDFELDQVARHTTNSIADMMGYKSRSEKNRLPILLKTIKICSKECPEQDLTIQDLVDYIDNPDWNQFEELSSLSRFHFKKLIEDLQVLASNIEPLLLGEQQLNIEKLLHLGKYNVQDKTFLNIISTKFLGDNQNVLFWMTQFFIELGRWISKNPSDGLQTVIMLDEADMYLSLIHI